MPSYKLHYFDTRGRGELIRLLFKTAGITFDDLRYAGEAWQEFKKRTPFGVAPVLEIDGILYGESGAIVDHLAKEFGLNGKNSMESFKIGIVLSLIRDTFQSMVKLFLEKDEEKKKTIHAQLLNEEIPKYYKHLETQIGSQNYVVGQSITVADLALFDLNDILSSLKIEVTGFPKLQSNRKLVESNPRISEYLKIRK